MTTQRSRCQARPGTLRCGAWLVRRGGGELGSVAALTSPEIFPDDPDELLVTPNFLYEGTEWFRLLGKGKSIMSAAVADGGVVWDRSEEHGIPHYRSQNTVSLWELVYAGGGWCISQDGALMEWLDHLGEAMAWVAEEESRLRDPGHVVHNPAGDDGMTLEDDLKLAWWALQADRRGIEAKGRIGAWKCAYTKDRSAQKGCFIARSTEQPGELRFLVFHSGGFKFGAEGVHSDGWISFFSEARRLQRRQALRVNWARDGF